MSSSTPVLENTTTAATVGLTEGNDKEAKEVLGEKRPLSCTDDDNTATAAGAASALGSNNTNPNNPPPKKKKWKKFDKKQNKKQNNNKRSFTKKGAGKWMKDFGPDGVDKRDDPPHEGSYANEALRKQFGIFLNDNDENENENKEEPNPNDEATTAVDTNTQAKESSPNNNTNKRKVALFLGFFGTKYAGFQMNAEQKTIQAEIELALYRAKMITKANFGSPHKYSWSNSARTDKGVHACAQVSSVKIELPETDWNNNNSTDPLDEPRKRLEAQLPSDIRVLDMVRTTRNFCAKTQRDRVRYQYMIPSFLLHPDWRAVMEQVGIDTTDSRIDNSSGRHGNRIKTKNPLKDDEATKLYQALCDYRSTTESRELLRRALQKYEGTNFFHNFTKGLKPGEAKARRFIETFSCQDPVIVDGVEWIPTQVLGQSFLLHQIRKMVCIAIDVARGKLPVEFLDKALDKKVSMALHVAPAQGLFLEMSYFGGYNRRKNTQKNHNLLDIDWTKDGTPAKDRWLKFRDSVRSHICQEEIQQRNFCQYLFLHECVYDWQEFYGENKNKSKDNNDDTTEEVSAAIKQTTTKSDS